LSSLFKQLIQLDSEAEIKEIIVDRIANIIERLTENYEKRKI